MTQPKPITPIDRAERDRCIGMCMDCRTIWDMACASHQSVCPQCKTIGRKGTYGTRQNMIDIKYTAIANPHHGQKWPQILHANYAECAGANHA